MAAMGIPAGMVDQVSGIGNTNVCGERRLLV